MPIFKYDQMFPLILKAINALWERHHTWVTRDQIVAFLQEMPEVQAILNSPEVSLQLQNRSPHWYIGNAVDWFSKRITDQSSPYMGVFNRRRIHNIWAYIPAGHDEDEKLIEAARSSKTKGRKIYVKGAEIGRGTFGVVYQGELLIDGKPHLVVAIKSFFTVFNEKEFNILSRLNHPNIIRLLDTFEDTDAHGHKLRSLVFEYAEDGTLRDKIENSSSGIPPTEARSILLGIARGLAYLHSIDPRVVHRDIKPANILFKNRKPHISDVGLARVIDTTTLTHSGGQTLAYAAPEMLQISPNQRPVVSPKVDIYALGITAFHMLTGKLPYDAWGRAELIWDHHHASIPDHPNVNGWSQTLIEKCTLKDYHKRWSAKEVAMFLENELDEDHRA